MNVFSLLLLPLLFASSLASASASSSAISTPIRGSALQQGQQSYELSSNHRRHLLQESSCTLVRKNARYAPTDEHPNGHEEHSWVCKLSNEDAKRLNLQYVDIVESSNIAAILKDATPSSSIMTMSEAIVDMDTPRMYIPENAHVEVRNDDWLDQNDNKAAGFATNGPPTTGKLRTLVLRITDGDNVSVTASLDQLKNDVFDDSASLKTQTEACSYGKLEIEPFVGNTPNNKYYISNGVVDVSMNFVMASAKYGYFDSAVAAATQQLGDLEDPMFDLIMICFPPGSPNERFLAAAHQPGKLSWYNDEWCSSVSAQMHEVGHNLGLGHSGQTGGNQVALVYGDTSGVMGFSVDMDDERRCYNPQKNYQLGWYDNKVQTINPLDGVGSREFNLNGVSDYKRNNNALVVLRLQQINIPNKDYYIGFNRADGITKDTREDKNMVTILRMEEENGKSMKIASLIPGERHIIKDYDGIEDVQIVFGGLIDGDARIVVFTGDTPLPTPPGNCQKFSIEVTTDKYPEDISWTIKETEDSLYPVEVSLVYNEKFTTTVQQVCLPMGTTPKTYKFTIYDDHGDGLTVGENGSYKIVDDKGKVIVFEDDDEFEKRDHEIQVREDPNPPKPTKAPTKAPTAKPTKAPTAKPTKAPTEKPTKAPTEKPTPTPSKPPTKAPVSNPDQSASVDECRDKMMEQEKFRIKEGGQKNTCKFYTKRNKCDETISTGTLLDKLVWEVCEKSCSRCGGSPPSSQSSSDDECKDEKKGKRRFRIKEDGRKSTCIFWAKRNKCDQTISTGKHRNKRVWELCKNSCNRC